MNDAETDALASRYLEASASVRGGSSEISIGEAAWLIDHCTSLEKLKLDLLRAVQAALPRSDKDDETPELKELLTNLIIMQTRLSERQGRLSELLQRLTGSDRPERVPVDENRLREGIVGIIAAAEHVGIVAAG